MKFRDVIKSAIANSFRSKLRTTLTVVAIFIGAFTLTITTAIGTGVSSYINNQVASVGAPDVLTITKTAPDTTTGDGPAKYNPSNTAVSGGPGGGGGFATGLSMLTGSDLDKIAATPGVSGVNPLVSVTPDYIQYGSGGRYQLTVNAAAALTKPSLAAGTQLNDNSTENQIILPTTYLPSLGLGSPASAVGKSVTIAITDYLGTQQQVNATVVGVANKSLISGGAGLNTHATSTLHSIQTQGRPANLQKGYEAATARFSASATAREVDTIKHRLHEQGFTAQTVADQIGSFETVINGIIGVLDAFAVIALIAAGFGIINTLLMSVQERTREIGLMKAMGMSGRKVYALFSSEAVFIGFLGSAIGAGIGIAFGSLISHILAETALSGLPGLQIMKFSPASIAVIIVVVMLIAFLAGTLPARRAARQNPIDALRYE